MPSLAPSPEECLFAALARHDREAAYQIARRSAGPNARLSSAQLWRAWQFIQEA